MAKINVTRNINETFEQFEIAADNGVFCMGRFEVMLDVMKLQGLDIAACSLGKRHSY
jgi:hypothetical protein